MKKLNIIIVTGIAALIGACSFSDTGIHYVDPIPGDPPTIHVSTNLDTMATIKLIDSLDVIYDVEIENGEFYRFEAIAYDNSVYISDSTSDSFWIIRDTLIDPGIDTLFLYFYYSTNTNSLADIVDLEYNLIELNFPIDYVGGEAP